MADWRGAVAHYISGEAKPVDKYSHQPRLYALTQQIGSGMDYDDDVVYAAAWLHDLGVFVGHRPENPDELAVWNHVAYTVARAPGLLRGFGFPPDKIVPVLECIENHQPADEPKSIESTILRDADILEQLGAIGIARTVCKVGRDTRFHTFADAAASLTRALETLPGCIRLPVARQLAVPRIDLLRTWLNALHAESGEHLN
jgi:uncharacterized protein